MLSLAIRYLTGRAAAADVANREEAEWPPHPGRLFMALVASWGGQGRSAEGQACLEWLEGQGAPDLCVPAAHRPEAVSFFVPVNDAPGGKLLPEVRLKKERHFPSAIPETDTVHFTWPAAEASAPHHAALARLCEGVTSLGRSSSLVQAWLEPAPPTPTLVPVKTAAEQTLRVASPGRFAQLEAAWAAQRFPDAGSWQGYAAPRATERAVPAGHLNGAFLVLRRVSGVRLGLESTLALTAAFRGAVMSVAGDDAPPAISGHDRAGQPSKDAHLAYVPLADVGHEHADGHLLGLAALLPGALSSADREACLRAIALAADRPLVMGRLGEWALESVPPGEGARKALDAVTWTKPSRRWSTVTPIVLDRYPRAEGDAEATIVQACERAGLPAPSDVLTVPVSPVLGTPIARGFPPEVARPGKPQRWHTHAILTFDQPVAGPVLLGAGRFKGYGFCRPLGGLTP